MGGRLTFLILVFGGAFALLVFHLYELQLVTGGYYHARAASEDAAISFSEARRGAIYFSDKNGDGVPAALDQDFPIIYAVPKELDDPEEAANQVSFLTGISLADLEKKFNDTRSSYALVEQKADDDAVKKIEEANIKGVYTAEAPGRFYPQGPLAAQLLGYVGPSANSTNNVGHYGLEAYYDSTLSGTAGPRDLTLTIDPNIEIEAEQILDNLVKAQGALSGSVIVEDPKTGKILAMGSYPNFDPNNYSSSSLSSFLNPAVQKIYEPGSVMKVITMAAGIDAGKITSSTTYVDTGTLHMNGYTISNYDLTTHGAYGRATMSDVIAHSINTGAVFAEHETGNTTFKSYLEKFGFGEATGIALPGEVHGDLSIFGPQTSPVHWATASYGQGVVTTPLGMIKAFAALANGGVLMRPYVDASLGPQEIRRVVSAHTAEEVRAMMINAVDEAQVTAIPGYAIGGKTGTAFIPDFVHGGYMNRVIDTYIGFGPGSNPQFIGLIKLDNLPSASLAAQSVVPAFRELAQFLISYENIAPDRVPETSTTP